MKIDWMKRIVLVFCLLLGGGFLFAQDGAYSSFTPYSVFGVGDLYRSGTAFNKGMGGVGVALRNKRYVNVMNPAAVTARDTLSIMADFALESTNKMLTQGDVNSAQNTFNLHDFIFSFPVYRKSAMYFGLQPFSSIGYNFTSPVTDPAIIGHTGNVTYTSEGSGSVYNLFIGGGVTLWDHWSFGIEYDHFFGNLKKDTGMTFSNASYRNIVSGYSMMLRGNSAKLGVQYEKALDNGLIFTAGATYRFGTNMTGYVHDRQIATLSSSLDTLRYVSDTLSHGAGRAKFGDELAIGVALRSGRKWMAEIDYIRSDWSRSGMDKVTGFKNTGASTFSATTAQSIRAGFSYTPNYNDSRYYLRRVDYRIGTYYDRAYYKLDGNNIDSFGVTFGVTLPIAKAYNYITLGVDIGQRASKRDNLVRERYVNFTISMNIFDLWFIKPRYD